MIPARLQPVLDEVRPLAEAFVAAGQPLYLVGGIVRDRLLARHPGAESDPHLTTPPRPAPAQCNAAHTATAAGPQPEPYWGAWRRLPYADRPEATREISAVSRCSRLPLSPASRRASRSSFHRSHGSSRGSGRTE